MNGATRAIGLLKEARKEMRTEHLHAKLKENDPRSSQQKPAKRISCIRNSKVSLGTEINKYKERGEGVRGKTFVEKHKYGDTSESQSTLPNLSSESEVEFLKEVAPNKNRKPFFPQQDFGFASGKQNQMLGKSSAQVKACLSTNSSEVSDRNQGLDKTAVPLDLEQYGDMFEKVREKSPNVSDCETASVQSETIQLVKFAKDIANQRIDKMGVSQSEVSELRRTLNDLLEQLIQVQNKKKEIEESNNASVYPKSHYREILQKDELITTLQSQISIKERDLQKMHDSLKRRDSAFQQLQQGYKAIEEKLKLQMENADLNANGKIRDERMRYERDLAVVKEENLKLHEFLRTVQNNDNLSQKQFQEFELKHLDEVNHWKRELERCKNELDQAKIEAAAAKEEAKNSEMKYEKVFRESYAQRQSMKRDLREVIEENRSLKHENSKLQSDAEKYYNNYKKSAADLKTYRDSGRGFTHKLDQLNEIQVQLTEENERLRDELRDKNITNAELSFKITKLESMENVEVQKLTMKEREKMEKLAKEVTKKDEEIHQLKNDLTSYQNSSIEDKQRIKDLLDIDRDISDRRSKDYSQIKADLNRNKELVRKLTEENEKLYSDLHRLSSFSELNEDDLSGKIKKYKKIIAKQQESLKDIQDYCNLQKKKICHLEDKFQTTVNKHQTEVQLVEKNCQRKISRMEAEFSKERQKYVEEISELQRQVAETECDLNAERSRYSIVEGSFRETFSGEIK